MAYRRKQGITRASTFKEETYHHHHHQYNSNRSEDNDVMWGSTHSPPSLAAQAIRASVAQRQPPSTESNLYDGMHDDPSKSGFWGVLARKAKFILDDDEHDQEATSTRTRSIPNHQLTESVKIENPRLRKGLDVLATSLNHIGDKFERALEEGRTMVESKTADIMQETRKLQARRKDGGSSVSPSLSPLWQPLNPNPPNHQADHIKASRDVAMATAAKAKLLLRELKTSKADLAFAKERCRQLEEENKVLRESREKGAYPADDDLIRYQLETLLAEKARLAHENSVYARENHFLREIVEYHQLTMQDVVYLDEGIEEVTEVYPIPGYPSVLSIAGSPSQTPPRTSLSEMFSTLDPPLSTKRDRLIDGALRPTKSLGEETLLRRDVSGGKELKIRLDVLLGEDGQMRRDASRKDLARLSASSSSGM